jgi:DNA repair exonuclease SbcCD ATPase subunit
MADTTETPVEAHEETIPYERFQQANRKAKEAADRAKEAEKRAQELQAAMEEREQQGLPELEQLRKQVDKAEKRAQEAERRAEEQERRVQRGQRERWVTAAAQNQNFADPSDASAFLNLDDIEDEKDAERAVKRLAGSKKHLLKPDEPQLPGRVLSNGQRVTADGQADPRRTQMEDEGNVILEGIRSLQRNWQSGGPI